MTGKAYTASAFGPDSLHAAALHFAAVSGHTVITCTDGARCKRCNSGCGQNNCDSELFHLNLQGLSCATSGVFDLGSLDHVFLKLFFADGGHSDDAFDVGLKSLLAISRSDDSGSLAMANDVDSCFHSFPFLV